MSTQRGRLEESDGDRVVGVSIVQKSSGSLRVTIPAKVAEELAIDEGTSVFVVHDNESEVRMRDTSTVDL